MRRTYVNHIKACVEILRTYTALRLQNNRKQIGQLSLDLMRKDVPKPIFKLVSGWIKPPLSFYCAAVIMFAAPSDEIILGASPYPVSSSLLRFAHFFEALEIERSRSKKFIIFDLCYFLRIFVFLLQIFEFVAARRD